MYQYNKSTNVLAGEAAFYYLLNFLKDTGIASAVFYAMKENSQHADRSFVIQMAKTLKKEDYKRPLRNLRWSPGCAISARLGDAHQE